MGATGDDTSGTDQYSLASLAHKPLPSAMASAQKSLPQGGRFDFGYGSAVDFDQVYSCCNALNGSLHPENTPNFSTVYGYATRQNLARAYFFAAGLFVYLKTKTHQPTNVGLQLLFHQTLSLQKHRSMCSMHCFMCAGFPFYVLPV
jgi:hypothetical protein